jgi:cardiolipin synthase
MVAIGFLIVGDSGPAWLPVTEIGWYGLWAAALLTLMTGWTYLQSGLAHMMRQDATGAERPPRTKQASVIR